MERIRKPQNITLHPQEIEALKHLVSLSDASTVSQFVGRMARELSDINEPFRISQITLRKSPRRQAA